MAKTDFFGQKGTIAQWPLNTPLVVPIWAVCNPEICFERKKKLHIYCLLKCTKNCVKMKRCMLKTWKQSMQYIHGDAAEVAFVAEGSWANIPINADQIWGLRLFAVAESLGWTVLSLAVLHAFSIRDAIYCNLLNVHTSSNVLACQLTWLSAHLRQSLKCENVWCSSSGLADGKYIQVYSFDKKLTYLQLSSIPHCGLKLSAQACDETSYEFKS